MTRVAVCCALVVSVACGPRAGRQDASNALQVGSGDAAQLEQLMRGSVKLGGLLFPDSECTSQFGAAGVVQSARFAAFARCLAALHLQPATRKSPLADVEAMTYGPGIEIEARIVDEDAGPRLAWIGYEAARDPSDKIPTIGGEALENLRTAGERNGPIDIGAIDQLGIDLNVKDDLAFTWMKVCLDAEGKVASVQPREASSLTASRVFVAATTGWQFRPFVAFGQPIAVCSYVEMVYPPQMAPKAPVIPMPSSSGSSPAVLVANANLARQRLRGTDQIAPSDTTLAAIERAHVKSIAGAFELCLDANGRVSTVHPLQSTGVAPYDLELVRGIQSWVYSPYLDGGKPVPVCTAAAFSYAR